MILSPVVRGGAEGSSPLGGLTLKWKAAASVGEAARCRACSPTRSISPAARWRSAPASSWPTPARHRRYVFGSGAHRRLEVSHPSLRLSIEGTASDPEARLVLARRRRRRATRARASSCRSTMPTASSQQSVQKNALDLTFSPEVIWSSRTGLTFNGQPEPRRRHSAHHVVRRRAHPRPPLSARAAAAASTAERPVLELEASTGLDVQLGPVLATIDRIGLRIGFDFAATSKNFGFADLSFGFKPPSGVGITVEAPAVSGGGYLFFDPDKGQYAGVVQLTIEGGLTLTAIGLITTRLPNGANGFSFLVIITAEDFKPIPLGLGFTLTGIGGLLAINRTCNEEFLRAGLKNKTLDDVLFPADPIRNAAHILSTFDSAFPARRGSYLFGPVAADPLGHAAGHDDGPGRRAGARQPHAPHRPRTRGRDHAEREERPAAAADERDRRDRLRSAHRSRSTPCSTTRGSPASSRSPAAWRCA